MDLSKLEQLAIDCAIHSAAIKKYKKLGSDSMFKCTSAYEYNGEILTRTIGDTCLQKVYNQYREFISKVYYYSFEEHYNSLDEGEVCEHCQATRKYKAKRIEAQKKLGYARSAITQVGKRLMDQTNIKRVDNGI